jgi:spore germination protein GerM
VTKRRVLQAIAAVVAVVLVAWAVSAGLERLVSPRVTTTETAEPAPETETAHITATLFYGSADGQWLVASRRDVPLAEGVIAQGRAILAAQLQMEAPQPLVSVMPRGVTLRSFFVTERGDAFVDASAELSRAHAGGSLNEMLTVYALVNAVTANLPAVRRVQILIDGKEVDTLAGHVDIRRPLLGNASLVREGRATPPGPDDSRLTTPNTPVLPDGRAAPAGPAPAPTAAPPPGGEQ